ncbi:MAG: hypothetical protein P4L46_08770 [Fimbriimonas sp.]|nr:hypothetical protein [Fimbriimonas sp.]
MARHNVLATIAGVSLAAELAVLTGPALKAGGVPRLEGSVVLAQNQHDSKLSVQFRSAKVSEVLGWLQSQGYSFVVNDGDLATSKTVTMNIANQSVGSVADAIANALGGHWEQTGGIHVYKKGVSSMNWMKIPNEGSVIWGKPLPSGPQNENIEIEKSLGPEFQKKLQEQFGPEFQKKIQDQFGPKFQMKMQEQFGPEFEKQMQDQFGPKFQKQMEEQFGPEFQNKMQKQFGPDFEKKMQDQFGPKFQKQMEEQFGPEFQNKMQKQFGPDFEKKMQDQFGQNFQNKMQKQFGPDFEKKMQDQFGQNFQNKMQKQFGPDFEKKMQDQFGQNFQNKMQKQFGPDFEKKMQDQFGPKFQKQMEDLQIQIQQEVTKQQKEQKGGSNMFQTPHLFLRQGLGKHPGASSFDASRFLNSLTPAERDEQKKQGYVWYSDLDRDQKAMFDQFDGKFDIDLKINGEEIRVRRN